MKTSEPGRPARSPRHAPWLLACAVAVMCFCRIAPAAPLSDFMREEPKPQESVYKKVGGEELKLYRFSPPDLKQGERRTAVVWIHGGGWTAGTPDTFFPHARYFASRGAVGFSIGYRLVRPESKESPTVGDCLADCKSAVRFLRAHAAEFGIDPARVVALGDSAGGHLAGCLATVEGFDDPADDRSVSAVPDAVVLYNPITDLTDPAWVKFAIGGDALARRPAPAATRPTAAQENLARRLSPLYAVRPHEPSGLVLHGSDDHVVSPEQSKRFVEAMTKAGNTCRLEIVEGARHAFVVPHYTASEEVVVHAIRDADSFLVSLKLLAGEPTLEVSNPPAWTPRKPKRGAS